MNQNQRNQGNLDLANMLKLFLNESCGHEESEGNPEGCDSDENDKGKDGDDDKPVSAEDIGEMMASTMLIPGMNFSEIMKDPKFKKVLNQTIKGVTEMLTGATKVVKDLPAEGLTVESGLAAVADAMEKNSKRSTSREFSEYVLHEDKKMAMEIMGKMYDGLAGVKVVWLTLFFIEIGWLAEPSPSSIMDAFNVKRFSRQLYSANKLLKIPTADRTAFSSCLKDLISSYKSRQE